MAGKLITRVGYAGLIAGLALALLGVVKAASNIDPVNKWAWGTNVGWINFQPANGGVTVYSDHLEGYAWAENVGWIRLGSYDGGGAHTYANTAADNYGVNNDGNGNLSGYAWSKNVGWIKFDPANGGVTIDPATGSFDGYAWGENVGWIHLKGTGTVAYNVVTTWRGPANITYASPTGGCSGNTPCYTSAQTAINAVNAGGTVYVYGGTYSESVNLSRNVTVTVAGDVTLNGDLTMSAGTFVAPSGVLALTGDFGHGGGSFDPHDGTIAFAGSGVQTITGATAFHNLTVNSGVTLTTSSDVTVTGVLVNSGWTKETKPLAGTPPFTISFGLANIALGVEMPGDLTSLEVVRRDQNHPHASPAVQTGRYWTLTSNAGAGGFAVALTLPHDGLPNPTVCRYDGSDWDEGRTSFTSSTVTRGGITGFSDWAVGNARPTAVTLASFGAVADERALTLGLAVVGLLVVGLGLLGLVWRIERTP